MSEYEWTCAGCGIPSPNKIRVCDCPTNVVCWDRKHEWKRENANDLTLEERNAKLVASLEWARTHSADLMKQNAKLVAGIQDYLNGNYASPRHARAKGPQEKCPHGKFYWEACENCIDEHFTKLLQQFTEKP